MILSYPLFHAHRVLHVLSGQVRDAPRGARVDAVHEKVVGELPQRLSVFVVGENRLREEENYFLRYSITTNVIKGSQIVQYECLNGLLWKAG